MKCAIVFGASGTIGHGIAAALSDAGYAVCLVCSTHMPDVSSLKNPYSIVQADITRSADADNAFLACEKTLGKPVLCVNAAGIALKQQLLADTSDDEIKQIFSVNAEGALYISRAAAKSMHGRGGTIIHISSLWGSIGGSCETVYSASKGAINAMVKALAKELAPDGITVNAVAPGLVPSPMNASLAEEAMTAFKEETPLNCFISPEDIARCVLYLADAKHVTGQIMAVDGGIVI